MGEEKANTEGKGENQHVAVVRVGYPLFAIFNEHKITQTC